ncbi:MAG: Clp protease N-terminal domain-containing protein [Gemmataceae bacterium]
MASQFEAPEDIFHPGGHFRTDMFRDDAAKAVESSLNFARKTRWDSVRSPHLFMGLLDDAESSVQDWGERLGADLPRLIEQFEELFLQDDGDPDPLLNLHREFFSDNVIHMLRHAYQRAQDNQRMMATPMDLLICLFTTPHSIVAECFERIGVTAARLTELAVLAEQASLRSV